MAAESLLVDDVAARLMERLGNTSTVDSNLDRRIRWALDDALRSYVLMTNPQDFVTTATKAIVAGTAEYAAPDDFHEFMPDGVRLDVTDYRTLRYMTREQFDRLEGSRTQSTGTPQFYIPTYRKASDGSFYYNLWPTPSANTTLRIYYRAIPASIRASVSGDATKFDQRCPTIMLQRLVEGAMSAFPDYLDAATLAWAERRWNEAIKLGIDSSVKQAGEPVIPDDYRGGRGMYDGPIAPQILT